MEKQEFINAIKNGAIEGYKKYKILPSLTMAQAILESGWGKNHIEYNLFGIKASSSWKGKVAVRQTKEFTNGKWITINAKFRAYNSFDESIEDHAKLLGQNKRYRNVTLASEYRTACLKVWKAGYATDPQYPQKLIGIIEINKLYQYDEIAKKGGDSMTLKVGDKGEEVKKLQENLKKLGYDVGTIDGIYGTGTKKAVEQFQVASNIQKDGIAGQATVNHIEKQLKELPNDWAKESWEWCKKQGYLDGKRPKESITREEFAMVIYRIYKQIEMERRANPYV